MKIITVRTSVREEMVEITRGVQDAVRESGVADGIATVYCPHTTAAITINENADPDVRRDMTAFLKRLIPQSPEFHHAEGNSDSHIKTSLTGPSAHMIVQGGRLMLGTWQGVYLCEFDGPRSREVWVYVG